MGDGAIFTPPKWEKIMRLTLEKNKKIMVPDDPDGGYINIKALSAETIASIESKTSETIMVGNGDVNLKMDANARISKVARACLIGWGNMFDADGKELKFNAQNVTKASRFEIMIKGEMVRFLAWVESCHTEFLEEIKEEVKQASEN